MVLPIFLSMKPSAGSKVWGNKFRSIWSQIIFTCDSCLHCKRKKEKKGEVLCSFNREVIKSLDQAHSGVFHMRIVSDVA